jgi:hypothetical protein
VGGSDGFRRHSREVMTIHEERHRRAKLPR